MGTITSYSCLCPTVRYPLVVMVEEMTTLAPSLSPQLHTVQIPTRSLRVPKFHRPKSPACRTASSSEFSRSNRKILDSWSYLWKLDYDARVQICTVDHATNEYYRSRGRGADSPKLAIAMRCLNGDGKKSHTLRVLKLPPRLRWVGDGKHSKGGNQMIKSAVMVYKMGKRRKAFDKRAAFRADSKSARGVL